MASINIFLNDLLGKVYLRGFVTSFRSFKILELDYGHFLSAQKWQSVDKNGQPIPWFSYPAIEYLKGQNLSKKSVFEFGSGHSTLFWAKYAKNITSVENNRKWFEKILNLLKKHNNSKMLLREQRVRYVIAINENNKKYDIIVIDGKFRNECSQNVIKKLKPGGVIILDNSDWYPNACKNLRNFNLTQIDFTGFGPINPYTSTTSFFIDKKFRPEIINNLQHPGSLNIRV